MLLLPVSQLYHTGMLLSSRDKQFIYMCTILCMKSVMLTYTCTSDHN